MPASSYDFNNVTDGFLTFTGSNSPYATIHVDETDVGDTIPFTAFQRQPVAVAGPEMGMEWSAFAATVFGPNGSMTLTFSYDVVSGTPGQLITSFNSLYVVDVATLGVGMTAVEDVYDQQGNLIGTQTYTYGGPVPADVVFLQGQESISVVLTIVETVASDSFDATIDMSLIRQTFGTTSASQLCTIGDYVWIDMNANGLQDSGDLAADGVTVHLTNADGSQILATTTTDSTGHYLFDHLQAGTYAIQFEGVDGFHFTTQGVGTNRLLDSDANVGTGLTASVTLTAGQSYLGLDAGLVIDGSGSGTLASVGDYVWLDTNRDGIQDGNEAGLGGVTVNLLNSLGTVIGTDITEADGSYSFVNLQAGTYQVEFVGLSGYGRSVANATVDTADSDADVGTGKTATFTLAAGEVNNTVDAGMYVLPASIGNYVWVDTDRDGIQDSNEIGLANVTVRLLNSAGGVITSTVTNGSGFYTFNNLAAGTYQVEFVTPTNYGFTTANAELNLSDEIDSDADVSTGRTQQITVAAGEANDTIDAGMYVLPASIGNYVWIDSDQDGLQDANESGLANVTVRLLNGTGGVISTTTTDGNGLYSFNNLTAGTYQVQFVTPTNYVLTTANAGLNLNDSIDSDAIVGTGLTQQVTLTAGQNNDTLDAGMVFCPPANGSIGNFVWYDCNNNGKQDSGESGLSGVTVKLMAADGTTVLSTTTTSSTGFYQFSNLTAGTYQVYFGTKSGYDLTAANQGTNDAIDSDASTSTRLTGPIALAAGENNTTVDAGMVVYCPPALASIGNFVWYDCNNDGTQNSGEGGISGVTVNLMAANGTTVLATTTTSSTGYYQFSNLAAGTYQVYFGTKSGYVLTAANQGTNDAIDSDASISTRLTGPIVLAAGENNTTVDAGMVVYCPPAPASIGNFVWYDCNNNGKQDSGESGLSGVTVKLMAADGTTVLATTTTSSSGAYQFSNLTAGTYQVYFGTKSGYDLAAANQGTNDAIDSDANTTTRLTGPITLAAGENNTSVDAGMVVYCPPATASLGNFVFLDTNKNGLQDSGEAGVSGVTVKLLNAAGSSVLSTTTTNASGAYSVANLTAGSYVVKFETAAGYKLTTANVGSNDLIDSDASATTGMTSAITLAVGEVNNSVDAGVQLTSTGLSITKVPAKAVVNAGETVSYKFYVTNTGTDSLTNIRVVDNVGTASSPDNRLANAVTSCGYNVGDCDRDGRLDVNEKWEFSVSVTENGCGNYNGGCNTYGGSSSYNNCGTSGGYNSYSSNNCNTSNNCYTGSNSNNCSPSTGSGQLGVCSAVDTATVTATNAACQTISASDTKNVQVRSSGSPVAVDGTKPTGSLSAMFGAATKLEFTYNPGDTVSLVQVQAGMAAVSGSNPSWNQMAFIKITNTANAYDTNAKVYFEGGAVAGQEIFADATMNLLTQEALSGTGNKFSQVAGDDIYAFIFDKKADYIEGTGPLQTIAYNASGSQAMRLGDTIGSLKLVGYVGTTDGYLVSN